jgi:hypothetical protein
MRMLFKGDTESTYGFALAKLSAGIVCAAGLHDRHSVDGSYPATLVKAHVGGRTLVLSWCGDVTMRCLESLARLTSLQTLYAAGLAASQAGDPHTPHTPATTVNLAAFSSLVAASCRALGSSSSKSCVLHTTCLQSISRNESARVRAQEHTQSFRGFRCSDGQRAV